MGNNIASFEKTSSSEVKVWAKFNAKINSALIFSIILTQLLLVFSKEAILFPIYLLADKANDWYNWYTYLVVYEQFMKIVKFKVTSLVICKSDKFKLITPKRQGHSHHVMSECPYKGLESSL